MRMAPVGLVGRTRNGLDGVFDLGCECAWLTHGHRTGQLAAGYLATVIAAIAEGRGLVQALDTADGVLLSREGNEETARALRAAREAATHGSSAELVARVGQGWVAEEALAIAIYCALAEPDPLGALLRAVNHDGDSDSTGAIAGNILGALHGTTWLPEAWLEQLELRAEIERIADDLATVATASADPELMWDAYPGW
jgi:ADP-ribosyl-[dinitrogen reductase] hydrolase